MAIQVHGRYVTFAPPKDAAYLIGDFTDGHKRPLPINGPVTIEFPRGAYIEYAFLDTNMQPLADLTNPERPKNPWYGYHRSITLPHNRFQVPPRPTEITVSSSGRSAERARANQTGTPGLHRATYP